MSHTDIVREQFNRQAETYAGMEVVRDKRILDFLIGISGVRPSDKVLDVACGPGFLTMAFAERAGRAVGVDITDTFVAGARAEASSRGLANVSFLRGDVENLHFGPATFDLALCKFAFHHFPRPARVLSEMRRVITRAGKIILMDMLTSEDPEKAALHNEIERLCDPSHAAALSESAFERMFNELQLKIVLKVKGETSYSLAEWLRHGGPSEENARRITEMLESSIEEDRAGLKVRRENGEIHFTHTGATFVLDRAA
jgi:ubiquinone/menaquinone biosynthesis C-methylase UbiE